MKEQFLQKIFSYIEDHALIEPGDTVLAGVSGGADSMCLLEVLRAYQKEKDFRLQVIHVEHGIRGEDSRRDAAYVQQFCEKCGIFCETVSVNACAYSVKRGISVEEAARELRYEAFEEAARADGGRVRIAVAHHMEDQAETVLWQMIRGSDIKGLGGMRAQRGKVIRPLLIVSRAQIEEFLREEGICWREDATNSDGAYTRNRLRMDVLPVLTQLNEQAVAHLCESAGRLQETEAYLTAQTDELYARCTKKVSVDRLLVQAELLREQPLMQRRVLYLALETVSGRAKDLGARHIALFRELFSHQVGRELALPYRMTAKRTYEGVELFIKNGSPTGGGKDGAEPGQIRMDILEPVRMSEISKKKYTKWFDYDKIKCNVQIRKRQSGDYLVIDSAGHRQKLKNYLVNEKIPQPERERLWLLADGSHIMWIIGHRISDYYKVDEHTKRVLEVQYYGGNEDE